LHLFLSIINQIYSTGNPGRTKAKDHSYLLSDYYPLIK